MHTPPTVEKLRVTVSVTPQVLDTFQRLAKASSLSTGRAMGDWLGDTLDAAQFMAETMEKARAAPKLVAQELHAYALGLGDETKELIEHLKRKGQQERASPTSGKPKEVRRPAESRAGERPPSGNTGGKGTEKRARKPVGKAK